MIDLFPTVVNLANLDAGYRGYGVDLTKSKAKGEDRWVLSELDSLYGVGFLNPGNLKTAHDRVTSRVSFDNAELNRFEKGTRQWAISNGYRLYRQTEGKDDGDLRELGGAPLPCEDVGRYRGIYEEMLKGSGYKNLIAQESSSEEIGILEERLRDLGYID
jgi:hypothetical protein